MTFGIVYHYLENAKGVTIPVTLISPYGKYRAAVKAIGEDICLFSNDAGLQLGFDVERGIPKTLVTPGGTESESFDYEMKLDSPGI